MSSKKLSPCKNKDKRATKIIVDTQERAVKRAMGLTEGEVIVERPGEAVLRGCILERGEERLKLFWGVQTWNFT